MKDNMKVLAGRCAGLTTAVLLSSAVLPTSAFAIDGPQILLPKMEEFIPSLIAFVVIWAIMAKLAWPSIYGAMQKREDKIKSDLDDAERSKKDAALSADEYKQKIAEAERKAESIVADAKREAEQQRADILNQAQKEAGEIITKAHGAVEAERHKAEVELSGSVVDLSVEIAGKILGDSMDEEKQRKLAEKYLAEVGSLNDK
ncbi:MAG: F0F1 ATP synthase subunit B [Atopobiaceae bacterium]